MDIKDKLLLSLSATTFVVSAYFFQQRDYNIDNINRGDAIGRLETLSNTVKQKPKGTLAWMDADKGQNLYFDDQVFTHNESHAKITLGNDIVLNLAPNTLIKLGKDLGSLDLNLSQGFFSVDIKRSHSKKINISLGGKQIAINSKEAKLQIQNTGQISQLYLQDGSAQVSSGNTVTQIESGTTVIPKGAVISAKVEAILAEFPYQNREELEKLFKLNASIAVGDLKKLLMKGVKIKNLVAIYQLKPSTDFSTLVKISHYEKLKNLTPIIRKFPKTSLKNIYITLAKDSNVTIDKISQALSAKNNLDLSKISNIKTAPISEQLTTFTLRPKISYEEIPTALKSLPGYKLSQINNLLRKNSSLNLSHIQLLTKSYPTASPKQIAILSTATQVDKIPSVSSSIPLNQLVPILKKSPNLDLTLLQNFSQSNKSFKIKQLPRTLSINPNISLTALNNLLKSNPHLSHQEINKILASNPTYPTGKISKIFKPLNKPQVKGLIQFLAENPTIDIQALDGSLKTNPTITLDTTQGRKKLLAIVNSNSKSKAFSEEKLTKIKKINPHLKEKTILSLLAVSPSVDPKGLQQYTTTFDGKTSLSQLKSLLASSPQVDLKQLTKLRTDHPKLKFDTIKKIYQQNPNITPHELNAILKQRPDITHELLIANISGIGDTKSLTSILTTDKSSTIDSIQSIIQKNPNISLSAISSMLQSDPSARFSGFIPISNLDLISFQKIQKKYPSIKTLHLQNILINNPKLNASDLQLIMAAAPKTEGQHLETILTVGKNIKSSELAQLLKNEKKYNLKQLIPLFAIRPNASPKDVLFALKNDRKLTLSNMISALQTNSQLHPRYVNSLEVSKSLIKDDLLIIKQAVRPEDNQDIFRIDSNDKVKLGWSNNAKSSRSAVIIASDPQFENIIRTVNVSTNEAQPISDVDEKIAEIQKILKKEGVNSNIKAIDIPSIVAINPNVDEQELIELIKNEPKLSGKILRSIMALKPRVKMVDLMNALKDNDDLRLEHTRTILSINPRIDIKDIGDILKIRKDISPSRLSKNITSNVNFKDVKDILINFPTITPEEINQITSTNPRVDLKNLFSLLMIQDNILPHNLNNTTKKYRAVSPLHVKQLAQKRPDMTIQSINSIMAASPKMKLVDVQQLIATDSTMSLNQVSSIVKTRPNIDFNKLNKLLINHSHIQAQDITPLLVENPRITLNELDNIFINNNSLTPVDLNAILAQNPRLKLNKISKLLKSNPSVDIKHIPSLLSANPNLNIDNLTSLLKRNPQIQIAELTPLLIIKKNLDLDDLSDALKNNKKITIADIQRHLLETPNKSLTKIELGLINPKEVIDKINSVIVEYPQVNRTELQTIIKSNPRFNILQYKSLLEENISSSDLHQILIRRPTSDLKIIKELDRKFSLNEVQKISSNHPNLPLKRLNSLSEKVSLDDLNDTLTRRPTLSVTDLSSLLKKYSQLEPNDVLQLIAEHKNLSVLELKGFLKIHPNTNVSLIKKIYNQNPKFSLKQLTSLAKKNLKLDGNELLEIFTENPDINITELQTFFKQHPRITPRLLQRIYKQRQHISLRSLHETLTLAPKMSASEIQSILKSNAHLKIEDINLLLRSNRKLSKQDIKKLTKAIRFNQVRTVIASVPLPIVTSVIEANPNTDLRSLKDLYSSHPYITAQDISKTITVAPTTDLRKISRFLTNNPRYKIYDVNDLLALNPNIDFDSLSKIHQKDPSIKKKDIYSLLTIVPSLSTLRLSKSISKLPAGQFNAFSSFVQSSPTTSLDSFDKLVTERPKLNISKLEKVITSNKSISIHDIYNELSKNQNLSIEDPKLIQNILSTKQQIKLADLPKGSYYWKVSSRINNINIEGPISSFRVELGTIPIPLYPKNDVAILTTNFERSVRIRWEKQEGAQYEIELTHWDEKNKVTTIQKFKARDNFIDLKDLTTRKYSWRVRVATSDRTNARWSTTNNFIIKNRPFFIPIYPTAKDKIIVNNSFPSVKFKWKGIPNTPYVITIAADRNFKKVIMKKTVKETSYSWNKPLPGKFYWKLSLTSNDLQSPHVQPLEIFCSPITLISPLKNQRFILFKREQQVKLIWKNLTPSFLKKKRKFEYFIELANDPKFKKILATRKTKEESVTLKFSYAKRYYWRIQIKNPTKYETPSFSTPFEIKLSPPPAPPVLKKNFLQEIKDTNSSIFFKRLPYRTIASEDTDFNTTYVDIGWYKVEYVKGYIVEIYKDIALTELIHRGKTEKNNYRWMAAKAGNFYYRLASFDHWNRQSPFTSAETMLITVPRSIPKLNEPKPDDIRIINNNSGMRFSWYKVKYSSRYIWELSKDPDFKNILLKKENYGSNEFEFDVPKNRITQIGHHYWRVHSYFPIGKPTISDTRRVSLENVMEFNHDLWVTGFGYTNMITETTQQGASFASEGTVNKGLQMGGSIEHMLTGKKLEYGRYEKKFQLNSEFSFRTVLNHIYPLPLEFSLKEKLITNKFNLWGYSPAIIASFEKSAHLSQLSGTLAIQNTFTILTGLGVHKEFYVNERKLDAYFELLTPLYFSTSADLYALPLSSLKVFVRARYNIWGPFDAGADFSYSFYNNPLDNPFTHSDLFFAGSLTLKLF